MGLRIIKCKATPNSIKIYFSEAVQNANDPQNYEIHSPTGTRIALTDASIQYFDAEKAALIILHTPLTRDNDVAILVNPVAAHSSAAAAGSAETSVSPSRPIILSRDRSANFDPGGNQGLTRVNGALEIEDALGEIKDVAHSAHRTANAAEEAITYPMLTEEVGYSPSPLSGPSGASSGGPGGSSLGQMVTKAMSDVLGWKVKSGDSKGFMGALTQSFTLTQVEGHTESKWTPRTYAVQTDLSGGISGAQASLYSRAKDALDQSLPLLDGLYALDPEADSDYVTASREVVRSQMTELVNELAFSGGPRVMRVNQYFILLLGEDINSNTSVKTDSDCIKGTLGNLRDLYKVFTMGSDDKVNPYINTVQDEQNTSNFRILADYFTSLAQSWKNNLQFFGLNTQTPFLGTQLVLISRQLSVTAELVDGVRFALDSVFIGPAERQTLQLKFDDSSLFLEDLLTWIQAFATNEGPNLIQTGGKFGIGQVVAMLDRLVELVTQAMKPRNSEDIPPAYFTARVRRALKNLQEQLRTLKGLADPVGNRSLPTSD